MQSDTKHTPGKWIVGVSVDDRGWPVFRLAMLENPNPESAEVQANARLIAAAPDLLTACKEYLEWGAMTGSDRDMFDAKFRAAILKAEGSEPHAR